MYNLLTTATRLEPQLDPENIRSLIRDDIKLLNLWDEATQRGRGNPTGANQHQEGNLDNVQVSSSQKYPSGNAASAALRRLRKDKPDLHSRVLEGELSPHAAMVEAGFRHDPPVKLRDHKRH